MEAARRRALRGAIVIGPALPAWADSQTTHVDSSFLRDGNPPAGDKSDGHWYREDTRVGGAVQVYQEGDQGALPAPGGDLGDGALALTIDHRATAKAQLMTVHNVYGVPLSDVDGLD